MEEPQVYRKGDGDPRLDRLLEARDTDELLVIQGPSPEELGHFDITPVRLQGVPGDGIPARVWISTKALAVMGEALAGDWAAPVWYTLWMNQKDQERPAADMIVLSPVHQQPVPDRLEEGGFFTVRTPVKGLRATVWAERSESGGARCVHLYLPEEH